MENFIHNLFITKKDYINKINNYFIEYKYLGKGGTGVVYREKINESEKKFSISAIKIIPKNKFNEEEYNIGLYLNDLINVDSINFIRLHEKKEFNTPFGIYIVLKMDLVDNNLAEWSKTLHTDKEWYECIFQILINLRILQKKINLFHRDMKPKNILLKNMDKEVDFTYELNNKFYPVSFKTIFYITDFAHSLSDLKSNTKLNTKLNTFYSTLDSDLYELKNLPQRLRVDKLIKKYNLKELIKIAEQSEYFKGYYTEEKKKIDEKLKTYPNFIREKHLARNITYFIIENNLIIIDLSEIMSANIESSLETLLDEDIEIIIDKIYKNYKEV